MLERLLELLREEEGPLTYVVLAFTSFTEYVVPPFPGDVASLVGTFLAATAGYSVAAVYLSLTAGSSVGGLAVYAFGRALGKREEQWPRFLRSPRTLHAIHTVCERFERHGTAYLTINRFVPAVRSVFFVAAGLAGLPWWRVLVHGGISAALWNGLILAVGFSVGDNWDALLSLYERYTWGALGLLVLVGLFAGLHWAWQRRRAR